MTVEFPEQVSEMLGELAARGGTSRIEVLRRAIATYKVLQDQVAKGSEVRLRAEDGSETRVILPH